MATIKGTTLTPAPTNASFNVGGPAYYQGGSPIADYNKYTPSGSEIITPKESVYPKIIIDEDNNTSNGNLRYNLTTEEYYDLVHHTHAGSDEDSSAKLEAIENKINAIVSKINEMDENGFDVSDWDATTPEKETEPTTENNTQQPSNTDNGSGDDLDGFDMEDIDDNI